MPVSTVARITKIDQEMRKIVKNKAVSFCNTAYYSRPATTVSFHSPPIAYHFIDPVVYKSKDLRYGQPSETRRTED